MAAKPSSSNVRRCRRRLRCRSHPNLTYNYRTDQELLDASRNAQIYCMNSGSQQVISNIVTNANGSKTITFRCSPR